MRVLIIAVATLLIGGIVVGVVLFQQSRPEGVVRAAGISQIAAFLADEHMTAARSGSAQSFTVTEPEELPPQMSIWVGQQRSFEETLFAPEHGLRFIGARRSMVPGPTPDNSAHLMFTTEDGAWASVFLGRYYEPPVMQMGQSYSISAPQLGSGAPPIVAHRPGGLVFYLVSEKPEGVAALQRALNVPEATQPLR